MGDYHPDSTLTPRHITATLLEDGSANPSVGIVFDVVGPSGRPLATGQSFEVPLTEAEAAALTDIARRVSDEVFASEGVRGLTPPPSAADAAPSGGAATP